MSWWLFNGDCVDVMKTWPACTFDSIVCDPPYGLEFMGKEWDSGVEQEWHEAWAKEALRMLKPGGHMLAFGGTRTYHRMACAIEDVGFEIRDSLHWFYGTGFPKSLNVGEGRGTALKPAHEPIVLARKPLTGTVEANVKQWGTGALNIDATRLASGDAHTVGRVNSGRKGNGGVFGDSVTYDSEAHAAGRWPANVLLDEHAAAELDAQSGELKQGGRLTGQEPGSRAGKVAYGDLGPRNAWEPYADSGGASRFFYVAKPTRKERDFGCAHLPLKSGGTATDRVDGSDGLNSPRAGAGRRGGVRNHHPTVKPVELMRYLVRLVTPPMGTVLDPFMGSATTGIASVFEGLKFVGIEREAEYMQIALARMTAAHNFVQQQGVNNGSASVESNLQAHSGSEQADRGSHSNGASP